MRKCLYPFTNLTVQVDGTAAPCCKYNLNQEDMSVRENNLRENNLEELFFQPAMENLRKRFLSGEEPEGCRACWDEEAAGIESMRQSREWYSSQKYLSPEDDHFENPRIRTLDLKFSTLCNLKCRICGPYLSSTWLKEAVDVGWMDRHLSYAFSRNSERKFDKVSQNLEIFKRILPSINVIDFHGGEPLMQPEHRMLLDIIDQSPISDGLTLVYNTNGTQHDPRFVSTWNKVPLVILNFSIDDLFRRFEYQRYPAKWDEVMVNIKKYQEMTNGNVRKRLCTTVSLYNIFYLDEFINHNMTTTKMPILLNMLHYPEIMHIKNLPLPMKLLVSHKLRSISEEALSYLSKESPITSVISYMMNTQGDPTALKRFMKVTETHDRYRGDKFSDVFPEYFSMIKQTSEMDR